MDDVNYDAFRFVSYLINDFMEKENTSKTNENSLNESSLALQFSMFHLAHSPILPILNKMSEFASFGEYLENAATTCINDFIPELKYSEK